MPTPESSVKRKVRKMLEELDCYYFMPATGGYGKSGVPDFVACHNGKFYGIECKAGKNQPTALQEFNLNNIDRCGGIALVINETNVDALKRMMGCTVEIEK